MHIKDYFITQGNSRPGQSTDPLKNYKQYVAAYTGDEDLVDFCFDAMLADVDFRKGEFAKWDAVAPDYSFIKFKTIKDEEVKIPLTGKLKTLIHQAHKARTGDLLFENQHILLVKIGAIIYFSTGLSAYELHDFSSLYKMTEKTKGKNKLPQKEETRLCTEPWNYHMPGLNGEVVPCSQIPAMWDIENTEALSIGLETLQKSLLEGNLNNICMNCSLKTITSTRNLKNQVQRAQITKPQTAIIAGLQASHKTKKQTPLPPQHLRFRISGTRDAQVFKHNGVLGSEQMIFYVEKYDQSPQRSLLDWGCGCGRYASHIMQRWPQISYTGCDVDKEAIDWCNDHFKKGTFIVSDFYPPTSFANEQFSSIIASSVMTHLTKQNQLLWLKEMHRILKPGGIFVASVLGPTAALSIPHLDKKLRRKAFIDYHEDPALKGIAPEGYYRDVFQTEKYTRQNWSTFFEVIEFVPGGLMNYQDLVILQKKESITVSNQKNNRFNNWFRTIFHH